MKRCAKKVQNFTIKQEKNRPKQAVFTYGGEKGFV